MGKARQCAFLPLEGGGAGVEGGAPATPASPFRKVRESGSVLVEAVVAVAILAVVAGVACRAVGDGARRTGAAERSRLAMLEARSRLAEVGADIPLAPGVSRGEDGALGWRVAIAPSGEGEAGRLLDVEVGVSSGGPEIVRLHSLRLAPPPASEP